MMENRIHITQGEFAIGNRPEIVITTLLGSCVACCIWDPKAGIGGMNHMLRAAQSVGSKYTNVAGINSMELLINALVKQGARRDRLVAKAFGGACMISGLSDVGWRNAEFTMKYLADEEIDCLGHSLGGKQARNLRFWPATGRVMQKMSTERIKDDLPPPTPRPEQSQLELFEDSDLTVPDRGVKSEVSRAVPSEPCLDISRQRNS
ncbi:MAG: chemotaxis protein CheD [Pseudomonadota bacterium]